ncbi:helix-turn-helix domain-containing protein [Nitrosomonas sp.]|uniref:helix-turn-helix domain-containing protein n=1 Tax=Nitrosomonas sp. TaxID=42353 RepID=UPI0025CBBDE7|nr:helix-turn-helix domain-containing protein [Nitrosomonas sp.]
MNTETVNYHLKNACEIVGGQCTLARLLQVSCPTVNQWIHGIRPIPAKRCPEIEKLVNGKVKCEQLRADIDWSYLRQTNSEEAA